MKRLLARLTVCVLGAIGLYVVSGLGGTASADQQCVDHSRDPAGCQPSTFDTPMAQMPSVRVNRQGQIDPHSSEADAKAGAFEVEKRLFLFRNLEHIHWVPLIPSERDPASGAWRGGDLDGAGDGRGLGVAGNCIFVGHANGAGVKHAINILKIQPEPAKQQPVVVGEIPAMVEGNEGFDDRELRSLVYKTSRGEDRYLLVRNAGTNTLGRMEAYRIDMNTCLPTAKSEWTSMRTAVQRRAGGATAASILQPLARQACRARGRSGTSASTSIVQPDCSSTRAHAWHTPCREVA